MMNETTTMILQRVVCRNWIHDNYCTETDKDNFYNPTDIHRTKYFGRDRDVSR